MIGLAFLAVACLWLWLANLIGIWLAKRLGFKDVYGLLVQLFTIAVLAVLPFIDHIVGMRQFGRLCAEETSVWIGPVATTSLRAKHSMGQAVEIRGKFVAITKHEITYVDSDHGIVLARYNYFSTPGGKVGGPLTKLGGRHGCSAEDPSNLDFGKLAEFKKQISK